MFRWLACAARDAGPSPTAELKAVFAALGRWFAEPGFRGCAMVNAATQQHDDPARRLATRHLGRYLELLTGIAIRAGADDPVRVGRQLLMLMEGAVVLADHLDTGRRTAEYAGAAAVDVLRLAVNRGRRPST